MQYTDKLINELWKINDVKEAVGVIGDISKYLDYSKWGVDLIDRVCKVQVIAQSQRSLGDALMSMSNRANSNGSVSPAMRLALRDFAAAMSGDLTEDQITKIFSGKSTAQLVLKEATQAWWKELMTALGPYGVGISVGQAVGKLSVNTLFNTSGMVAAYYKMEAAWTLEKQFRAETIACQRAFESNPTTENAKAFIAAFKLLEKDYVETLNVVEKYVEASYGTGAINEVRNHIASLRKKEPRFFAYQQLKESIASIRRKLQGTIDTIDALAYNAYLYAAERVWLLEGIDLLGIYDVEQVTATNFDDGAAVEEIRGLSLMLSDVRVARDMTLGKSMETAGDFILESGTLNLNGYTLDVYGDLIVQGGTLNLNGGLLNVRGDVRHSDGTLDIGGGELDIAGSYYQVGSDSSFEAGAEKYTTTYYDCYLKMQNASDVMRVSGDFITKAHWGTHNVGLTAGTLYIGGNFRQYIGSSSSNFTPTEAHRTVFNGKGRQTIYFGSENSRFGILQVTKPISEYEINRSRCWQRLVQPFLGAPDFTLPAAIARIEEAAFEGAAVKVVYIPDTCARIGAYAFRNAAIEQIRIPAGCAVGTDAFAGCKWVTVFGTPGSAAERYCNSHDNCFFVAEG